MTSEGLALTIPARHLVPPKPPSHFRRLIRAVICPYCRLELIREPVHLASDSAPAAAASTPDARAAAAAREARFHRQPQGVPAAGGARRGARAGHARLLPVLARHRHPPASL